MPSISHHVVKHVLEERLLKACRPACLQAYASPIVSRLSLRGRGKSGRIFSLLRLRAMSRISRHVLKHVVEDRLLKARRWARPQAYVSPIVRWLSL